MTTINNVSTTSFTRFQTPAAPAPSTAQAQTQDEDKRIVIEITPGEDNVDSGDRSQNSAVINVTTPNNEFQAEVTREQVFNRVERQHYKNLAGQVLGNDNDGSTLRKAALLKNADQLEPSDIQQAAYLNVKQSQIDTYRSASENSIYNNDSSSSSNSTYNNDMSGAQAYTQAKNAYMKQEFIFSTLDRVRQDISEKA